MDRRNFLATVAAIPVAAVLPDIKPTAVAAPITWRKITTTVCNDLSGEYCWSYGHAELLEIMKAKQKEVIQAIGGAQEEAIWRNTWD